MIHHNWEPFFRHWTVLKTTQIQRYFLNEILNHTEPDDHLLEIGAGSGLTSLILYYSGRKNIIVSDVCPQILERFRAEFPLRVEYADMFSIDKPNQSVDCIFHQGLMEHFSNEEIVASFREQGRVAKQIVFDVPNDRRWHKIQEFGDERFLSVVQWVQLIELAGLRVTRVTGRRLPKGFPDTEWIRTRFGTASIFVCEGHNDA